MEWEKGWTEGGRREGGKKEGVNNEGGGAHVGQVLSDIEMLAHTDFFVGSYNSGLVSLVEILRYTLYRKNRYTFVDASVQHRDWSSGIRCFLASRKTLQQP